MNAPGGLITTEIDQDVLWVRINRPEARNALSRAALSELACAATTHAAHAHLKAAVITGEGTEAFAAGGDLKELGAVRSAQATAEFFDLASHALDAVRHFPLPVVAALNGWALGGGAELALACDFRVAAAHASIGYIHATLGITCGFGGGADLSRLIGPSAALRHCLNAEPLDAARALAVGLVDAIAAPQQPLRERVLEFLAPLLARPVQVLRACKAMAIAQRNGASALEQRGIERESFIETWTHEDHWLALAAAGRGRGASRS